MKPRQRLRVRVLVGVALVAGVGAWAQCTSSKPISNVIYWQENVTGNRGTTILTKFWQVGAGASANSGTLPTTSMVFSYSTGYYVETDWHTTGVVGCPCPGGNCGTSRTAFLYSLANNGNTQYILMSVVWSAGQQRYDLDAITNGNGSDVHHEKPVAMPAITPCPTSTPVTGGNDILIQWPAIASLKGFYDTAPTDLITGVAAYYWNNAVPPAMTDNNISNANWVLASGGPSGRLGYTAASNSSMTIFIPNAAPAPAILALELYFDGATPGTSTFLRTDFVGPFRSFLGGARGASVSASNDRCTDVRVTSVDSYCTQYGCEVYRGSTCGSGALVGTISGPPWLDDTSAVAGTTYWYWINYIPDYSQEDYACTPCAPGVRLGAPPPSAPALSGVGQTSLTLNWSAVPNAISYDVWRAQGTTCTGAVKITSSPRVVTNYNDSSLACGTPYAYYITANSSSCGASVAGACNTVTTSACSVPPPETAQGGTQSDAQSWLGLNTHQWPSNAQATSYNLYRGIWADLPALLGSGIDSCTKWTGTATNCAVFDDPSTVPGGFYWYLVTGVNANGEGSAGNATAGTRTLNSSGVCP